MENPFGITREEVLNLAAQKLSDQFATREDIEDHAHRLIRERVEETLRTRVVDSIESFLSNQLEALVSKEIVPVDIWGERAGEPTTIREQLHKRAKEYWDTKVDNEGKPSSYYAARPRHEYLFGKIVQESFARAISQDLVNIVGALKDALIDNANATVREKIDSLIKVKTKK